MTDNKFNINLSNELNWWDIPLGVININDDYKIPYVWSAEVKKDSQKIPNANCLVSGEINGGKTNLLNNIILHLVNKAKTSQEVKLYLADGSKIAFTDYENLKEVECVARTPKELLYTLIALLEEIAKRKKWLQEHKLRKIPLHSQEFPACFLIIKSYDEFIDNIENRRQMLKITDQIQEKIGILTGIGHTFNIHTVLSSLSWAGNIFTPSLKNKIQETILCGRINKTTCHALFEQEYTQKSSIQTGLCTGNNSETITEFIAYQSTYEDILKLGTKQKSNTNYFSNMNNKLLKICDKEPAQW